MPVFHNLDGTTRSEFSIGKTNTIKLRTNSGVVEWQNVDGYWHKLQVQTYIKIADPTVNDDVDQGYLVTDFWFNNVSNAIFICEDNSNGAAIWTQIGGASDSTKKLATQVSHGFAAKDTIRYNGTAWVKAKADNAANAEALAIVESVNGNDFTFVMSGYITLSGLTAGSLYFLSEATDGLLTVMEPTVAGQVSKPMMFAISTTVGVVINMRGTVLGSGGVLGQSYVYQQPSAAATWTVQHNLGSNDPVVMCYDSSNQQIFPDTVTVTDANTVTLTFNPATAGKAIVMVALGYTSGLQRGAADVRLDLDTTTSVKVAGIAATSKRIEVNGYAVDCTTAKVCNKTDNLITSAGADAAAAMSVSTFYYGYVSNHLATYAPSSLRFSATAPTSGYLGASSNAANWRYIGDVYLESDGFFKDDDNNRLVRSEYNIIWKELWAYNSTNTWTGPGSSVTRESNSGTGQVRGYFIGDGKSAIHFVGKSSAYVSSSSRGITCGFGYDSVTSIIEKVGLLFISSAVQGSQIDVPFSMTKIPTKALHYITTLEVGTANAIDVYGTAGSNYLTFGTGTVPC